MAGGKGSRMTDLTSAKAKCLLPVGNVPLVWYPLYMLQTDGFTEAVVIVPDSAKSEVSKIPERFGLTIKLDVVGIPGQEELGTADSLRRVADKLTGSNILVLSGDLILEQGTRSLVDKHLMNRAALTALLTKPIFDLKNIAVPGPKSTKFKKERDLIGLSGDQLSLFTAEADVEEEVVISNKVLRANPRMTVHTNLLDAHLYIFQKWVCDFIIADKNISTIKGELLPILVKKQFGKSNKAKGEGNAEVSSDRPRLLDFIPENNKFNTPTHQTRYGCYAFKSKDEGVCLRVNTVPSYWEANKPSIYGGILTQAKMSAISSKAEVGEKANLTDCKIGFNCTVSNKTTLTNVVLGAGSTVDEKVRITNCVIMDNVTVGSGCNLQDSIICDNSTLSGKVTVKGSIVGRGQVLAEGADHENQLLLDKDRMMEV